MMTDLLSARSLMAMSLGFHIIFAVVGMAMPLLMIIAEWRWIRTGQDVYLALAKRWAKGTAILFAVGAVSGTVLSFQLGLLWPRFMEWAGPIIGPAFSIEGFAFFTEAIFLGIYLYGWNRVRPLMHLTAGALVTLSGIASGVFVVLANGWMNTPRGFTLVDGMPADIDPIAALLNPSGLVQVPHMIIAAFGATGFVVAGIHAFLLLRNPRNVFHQKALMIAFLVGGIAALAQPLSGHSLATAVAEFQPTKLAAVEGHFKTDAGASFRLGGIVDSENETVWYALEIPYGLSLLLYADPDATVKGLDQTPRGLWPPVGVVRTSFQIMIIAGFAMAGLALVGFWLWWRRGDPSRSPLFLKAMVVAAPLGFIATEAGWVSTEVGRQPWVITGFLKTADAVTPMPGLIIPLVMYGLLYLLLGIVVVWLMLRHISASPEQYEMKPLTERIQGV